MDLAVSASRLAGNPGPSGWIQVYEYAPPDIGLLKLKGKLFVLISIDLISIDFASEEIGRFSEGREVLIRLQDEYYKKPDLSAFESLKTALGSVLDEYQSTERPINIAAASFVDGVLYTAVTGNVMAGVIRDEASVKILIGKSGEVVSASGYPKEKDVFVLGTNQFYETFSDGEVKEAFTGDLSGKVPERFESKILSSEDTFGIGVIALRFGVREENSLPKLDREEILDQEPALGVVKKAEDIFSDWLRKINGLLPKRRIVVGQETRMYEESKEQKRLSTIGLILLAILLVSIIFGIRQNSLKKEKNRYRDEITKAVHSLEEAVKISSIDKARSRELFLEAKTISENLKDKKVKNEEYPKLVETIKEKEGEILGEYQTESELYLDLSLIVDGFSLGDMSTSENEVAFLDKEGKRAVFLSTETKRADSVSGIDDGGAGKRVAVYNGRIYVLNDNGVSQAGKSTERIIEKEWGEDVFIRAYGGNLYLFDKGNSTIYRYPGLTTGFATKQLWLAPGIKPDFSGMLSWTIDGTIWVGFDDGSIQKYTQGSPRNVEIKGIGSKMAKVDAIYSDNSVKDVYLLDKGNARIVVMDKEGNYICQYKTDDLKEAANLFVIESKKLAVFAKDGSKLYSIELKHL